MKGVNRILLHFYLVTCAFVAIFLGLALAVRNRNLVIRSVTLLALAQCICGALWVGWEAFAVLVGVIYVLGASEILRHFGISKKHAILFIPLGAAFSLLAFAHGVALYLALAVYVAIAILSFWGPSSYVNRPPFGVFFICAIVGFGSGFLVRMQISSVAPVISFLLLLQCNDAFGYLIGHRFGATRLFPVLSPKKSLEGYFGSAVGIIIGLLLLFTPITALSHVGFLSVVALGEL